MAKNVVEDIIKTPKREPSVFFSELAKATNKTLSTQEVKPKSPRSTSRSTSARQSPPPRIPKDPISPVFTERKYHKHARIWVFAAVSVFILFFALSFLFSGASVSVSPKTVSVDIATDFASEKDAILPSLPFQLMAISASEKVSNPSTGSKVASSKATGTVVLFNEYSTTPQNLLINTRLEAPNGKIYYTDKAVSIPGYKKTGTTITPGSVDVKVTAAEAGEEYNSPLTDFTIIGFKTNADKYAKMYGRSRTEISGGATGNMYTVSAEEASASYAKARETLNQTLMTQARTELPEGFVLFDNALFISIDEDSPITESKETEITQVATGTAQAFIFKRSDLHEVIARKFIQDYDGDLVHIPELDSLVFELRNKDTIVPATVEDITINLTGSANIIWDVNTEEIISSLVGKRKKDFQSIMSINPNIQSAEVVIKPFWERKFPTKPESIEVLVKES
ncbi:hypothetical protein IPJ63_03255 [Candidatus Nomurabacteria bacterium]|nr:MAG: hypothetical protein IPJ63_03255 [Candidatus Nomurabacteria bacterium]